jgi:hypothetical protein
MAEKEVRNEWSQYGPRTVTNFLRKGRTGFFPITGSLSSHFQSNRPARDSNAMDIDALNECWSDNDDEEHIDAFSKEKPAKCFTGCFN